MFSTSKHENRRALTITAGKGIWGGFYMKYKVEQATNEITNAHILNKCRYSVWDAVVDATWFDSHIDMWNADLNLIYNMKFLILL